MRKLYASLFLTSALFMQTAAAQKNKVITIEGSSTLTPVFQEIASGFGRANKVGISVGSKGSDIGITCIKTGACDIGLSSKEVKELPPAIQPELLGWDSIGVIADDKSKITSLTTDQVSQIFNGKIKNWKEINGVDLPIIVFQRAKERGTRELFDKHFKIQADAQEAGTNDEVMNRIRFYTPGGISYMSLGVALKNKGKGFTIVKIDDIEASEENVKNGKYKIKRPLIMLFNKVNKDESISDFVNSVLARKKEVLEKNEFIAE